MEVLSFHFFKIGACRRTKIWHDMWCSFEGDEFGYLIADNTDASDSFLVGLSQWVLRGWGRSASILEFEICSKNL